VKKKVLGLYGISWFNPMQVKAQKNGRCSKSNLVLAHALDQDINAMQELARWSSF